MPGGHAYLCVRLGDTHHHEKLPLPGVFRQRPKVQGVCPGIFQHRLGLPLHLGQVDGKPAEFDSYRMVSRDIEAPGGQKNGFAPCRQLPVF